jgi:hypothetical protein
MEHSCCECSSLFKNNHLSMIITEIVCRFCVCLGWIASKVKEVAPVLPQASPTMPSPLVNDGLPRVPTASMISVNGDKLATRRRGRNRKKTTTASNSVGSTDAPDADADAGEGNSSKREKSSKRTRKRSVRATWTHQ